MPTSKKPVTETRRNQIRQANARYYEAHKKEILAHRRARYAAMVAALNALKEGNEGEETASAEIREEVEE